MIKSKYMFDRARQAKATDQLQKYAQLNNQS